MSLSILTDINTICSFGISADHDYIENCEPPLLRLPRSFPVRIEDVQDIQQDYFGIHYSRGFHDCTVRAYVTHGGSFGDIDVVTDRNCLRKLLYTFCLPEKEKAYYCKKEDFTLMAENIEGTLFLGKQARYDPVPGSYGMGLERLLQDTSSTYPDASYYRLVRFEIEDLTFLVRFEVDGQDEDGQSIDFRAKKKPNPRYGLSADYYQNIFIQMLLSGTVSVFHAIYQDGIVNRIDEFNAPELQGLAELKSDTLFSSLRQLVRHLKRIRDKITPGSQGTVECWSSGGVSVKLNERQNLPILSSAWRSSIV